MHNIKIINTNKNTISLYNTYKNSSAFLILNGPSFNKLLESKELITVSNNQPMLYRDCLNLPGFITMGINNSVKSFRPHLWTCVDEPNRFIKSIWLDPKIQKFIPKEYMSKTIFDNDKWEESNIIVNECPNVFGIERNEKFNHKTFLTEDTFNWGNHKNYGGGRSVMLVAIKLLYYLGVRKIFLLGCDFKMDKDYTYHFEQSRTQSAVNNNNRTYHLMKKRFELLKPMFEKNNLYIYNCNSESALEVFDFVHFKDAVKQAYGGMTKDILNERTKDMYNKETKTSPKKTDSPIIKHKSKIPRIL